MKYDIRICGCGRIHAIPSERIHSAVEDNKEFLLVCGGCGAATFIGADYRPEGAYGFDEPCYDMYSYDAQESFSINSSFTGPEGRPLAEVFIDKGLKVPMMTGEYAGWYTHYTGFVDMSCPDFSLIDHAIFTTEDVERFSSEYCTNRKLVNMTRFICENQGHQDVLEELSARFIEGLHWEDTEFDPNKSAKKTNCFK